MCCVAQYWWLHYINDKSISSFHQWGIGLMVWRFHTGIVRPLRAFCISKGLSTNRYQMCAEISVRIRATPVIFFFTFWWFDFSGWKSVFISLLVGLNAQKQGATVFMDGWFIWRLMRFVFDTPGFSVSASKMLNIQPKFFFSPAVTTSCYTILRCSSGGFSNHSASGQSLRPPISSTT